MTGLPARDLVDVHLADRVGGTGCPVCGHRADAGASYLDSILDESVNDVRFRASFDETRGFCRAHVRELLERGPRSGGILGVSILYEAMLRRRLAELAQARSTQRRGRGQALARAAAPAGCLACTTVERAGRQAIERLVELADDSGWRAALTDARFCLADLVAVMEIGRDRPGWRGVEEAQLARLGELADRLRGYAYHSSHDRRHLMTDSERTAAADAADVLGGT